MRQTVKKILHPILVTWHKLYYLRPKKYTYKGSRVIVHRDVFPPQLTISTKLLVDFMEKVDVKEKKILELGCGSGLVSVFAAQRGANVTATDINTTALLYLTKSAQLNKVSIDVYYSDLFDKIDNTNFDYIIINPPYYPKTPLSVKEKAWFCGENFEYFELLFSQLYSRLTESTECFMILSEDCKIDNIQLIAQKHQVFFTEVFRTKKISEEQYIYKLYKRL